MALLKAKRLKERLTRRQTDCVHELAQRLEREFDPSYGPADIDALMVAEGVVYDIEKIIYRQPKRR
jgi:hypothetical protein